MADDINDQLIEKLKKTLCFVKMSLQEQILKAYPRFLTYSYLKIT